jgi:transcription factor TFIIIB component B''
VNGRIVINQQSLVVAAQASTREDTETYRRVEEDRPKLNYNSYSNRTPVERWKAEDTDLFYKALQQFGTDFELIQNLFPGRTRRQVKAKFKNEEKLNPVRLADALGRKTQDQSHHYRAIIEMLKTEKENENDSEENLLESLLNPVLRVETADGETVLIEGPASTSGNKPDEDDTSEPPVNPVVLEKVKPDERPVPATEPIVSSSAAPLESEVAETTVTDDPPASEAPDDPLPSYQSKTNASVNPLGNYGKQTFSGNPLGSYGKNPLGMYK